jgi:hypothetical protein
MTTLSLRSQRPAARPLPMAGTGLRLPSVVVMLLISQCNEDNSFKLVALILGRDRWGWAGFECAPAELPC